MAYSIYMNPAIRKLIFFVFLTLFTARLKAQVNNETNLTKPIQQLKIPENEVRENPVTNFPLFRSNRMVDESNGGFYGRIDRNRPLPA